MSFTFEEFLPSKNLRKVIKSFFVIDYEADEPRKDFLLPNGTPSFFLIKTANGVQIKVLDSMHALEVSEGLYVGYVCNLVEIDHNVMQVMGVSLYPMYLYLLIGITPKELLNKFMEVPSMPELSGLEEIIRQPRLDLDKIPPLMEQFVSKRLENHKMRADIESLFEELTSEDGYRITVDYMAQKVGYTRRHLSDLFNKYLGMSPKQYIKLTRFNQALKLMAEMKSGDTYATVAHNLGYHDQAHFIRDFKSVCGKTPRELKSLPESLAYQFRYFK